MTTHAQQERLVLSSASFELTHPDFDRGKTQEDLDLDRPAFHGWLVRKLDFIDRAWEPVDEWTDLGGEG